MQDKAILNKKEIYHIDRGYSDIEQKLYRLGAKIRREK